ncbi:hypothetical protein TWF694_008023 [Orbilia ellipsospora]|uniref:Uncharacterized protein n=1 Tax=Orbilia ellipsospora TaxID=2528407 RepID=A0AAV9XHJ2_9PEZI
MSVYSISDLAQKLGGGTKDGSSLLKDWDVMVAYDEFSLNNLLSAQGAAVAAVQTVPEFTVSTQDGWGDTTTFVYDLTLSNPTLQFLPENSKGDFLEISFGLTGTITKNGTPRTIEPDWAITMVVTAPLVSAEGTVSQNGAFTGDPTTVQSSSGIVMTPTGKQNMVCICLQKDKLESITFTSTTTTGQNFISDGTTLNPAINDLATHLDGAASLSFYLSGVQGSPTNNSNNSLQPVCFMFSLVPAADPTTGGALCMWICVEGGVTSPENKGGQQTGLELQDPNSLAAVYPIPSGRNAAIYFNHTLIMNEIFLPPLTQAGLSNVEVLAFDTTKGLYYKYHFKNIVFTIILIFESAGTHISYNLPSNPSTLPGGSIALNGNDPMDPASVNVDSISFNPKDFTSDLYIKAGISTNNPNDTPLITFNNASSIYQANWSETVYTWEGRNRTSKTYSGKIDVTLSLPGQSEWQPAANTATPQISTTFNSTYTMTQTPVSGDTSWWQKISGEYWSNQLPPQFTAVPPSPPSISFTFPSLGYFLETNLLLPGANVFTPDPSITDQNNLTGGIAIPWDMIISGSIAKNLSTSVLGREVTGAFIPSCHRSLPPQQTTLSSTASTTSLEEQFISQVSNDSNKNTILSDLWNVVNGDDLDSINTQLQRVVSKYGFGNLDYENLANIMGYSYETDLAFMDAPVAEASLKKLTNGTMAMNVQDNPSFTFDLGVYSGVYTIDGSSDQLLLSPDTHAITYAGTTVVPETESDGNNQNPKYTVTWSSGSTANKDLVHYSVQFKATQIAKTANFQQSFSGTQTPDGGQPQPFAGTKLAPTPPFDIRWCYGTYVVSAPSDLKDSDLYVDRTDGSIEWQGDTFQPNLSTNTTTGTTTVSWTDSEGVIYAIFFYTTAGTQYFSGSLTTNGVAKEFKGKMKQDGSDPGIHDSVDSWTQLGNANNVMTVIFSTFTVGTIALATYKFWKREERKSKVNNKAKERDDNLVKSLADTVTDRKGAIDQSFKQVLTDKLNTNNDGWNDLNSDHFNDGARAIIQEALDRYYDANPNPNVANENGINDPSSPFWGDVYQRLHEYVSESVKVYGNDRMNPIDAPWKDLLSRSGFSDPEIADLTKATVDPRVATIVSNLMGNNLGDANTWARARANEVSMGKVSVEYKKLYDAAVIKVNDIQNIVDTYPGQIATKSGRITEIDQDLKKENLPDDERQRLEQEKSGLQNEIDNTLKPDLEKAQNDLQPAKDERDGYKETEDDARGKEPGEKTKGDDAIKRAFDL